MLHTMLITVSSILPTGVVVAAVDIIRTAPGATGLGSKLRCKCRLTTRGMWLDKGKLLDKLHEVRFAYAPRVIALFMHTKDLRWLLGW